ncbi:MAG: lytic transglycosylase domain-containing protein [Rhodocyclales bacterium]|nr:lytic transglycosylase domain-containing protein [Rhodocyclales bacterium]
MTSLSLAAFPAVSTPRWSNWCSLLAGLLILWLAYVSLPGFATQEPVVDDDEAPQIRALLAQAWASESGRGVRRNPLVASALYGQAGKLGSAEGLFRAGKIQLSLGWSAVQRNYAACLFAAASQLGHHEARLELDRLHGLMPLDIHDCSEDAGAILQLVNFDLDRYVSGLPLPRRRIVALIRDLAPRFGIDPRLALAVATVESNLDPWAVSPKRAMGVMQLIPETAERFNVRKPFDAEQNIRGGLAYLRWLQHYYRGDTVRVVAAYNAGEGAVDRFGGVPPYLETVLYVSRVMGFSGRGVSALPPPAAGGKGIVSAK